MPAAAVVAVAAGLLLSGCAGDDGAGDDPTTAAPTTVAGPSDPAATEPPDQTGEPEQTEEPGMTESTGSTDQPDATQAPTGGGVLTEQDSGAQVVLAVGEERPLRLGSAWSWSEPLVDGAAVTLTPVDYLVDPGFVEWLVTGTTEGTATLEVVGEPVCGDTTVCPPTTVSLQVDVTG